MSVLTGLAIGYAIGQFLVLIMWIVYIWWMDKPRPKSDGSGAPYYSGCMPRAMPRL